MLKKQLNNLVTKYGWPRLTHITLSSTAAVLTVVLVLELSIPVKSQSDAAGMLRKPEIINDFNTSEFVQQRTAEFSKFAGTTRSSLFKPSIPMRDKPMAERTIERIKSKLELQCIMEINGEPVAYINIKGVGLKRCKVGDRVIDLFTVVNINRKSVETKIVGHKVVLSL